VVLKLTPVPSLFPTSAAMGEGFEPVELIRTNYHDVGIGIVPIGGVTAWFKTLIGGVPEIATLLPNWVECNGQVLNDSDSLMNGLTIPNLNGGSYFLRGQATSGGTGGTASHTHGTHAVAIGAGRTTGYYSSANHLPTYTNVVWVMRIK